MEREEREIKLDQEETEVVNLGTSEEKNEVKIITCVSANIQDELVAYKTTKTSSLGLTRICLV